MWRNDTKCKYMFMFPLKNLARKGLISKLLMSWWHWEPVLKNFLQNGGHFVNALCVNTSRPVQNGHHFADICKCILLKENICVLIQVSQKFVTMGQIDKKPIVIQVIAWHQINSKLLPQTMLTKIYDAIWHHKAPMSHDVVYKIVSKWQPFCGHFKKHFVERKH